MADDGETDADRMRRWLEAEAERLGDVAHGAVWQRAEALFQAWSDLISSFGPSAAGTASPFDPSEWLKPANPGSMLILAEAATGAGGLLREGGTDRVAWRKWVAALDRHRALTGAAWLAVFREFAERSRRAEADARRHGKPPPDRATLEAMWLQIADAEFARTMTSDDFLTSQRTLLEAGLELRRALRERVEALAELTGLPTRAEVDDMAAELDRLRRDLRRLRGATSG